MSMHYYMYKLRKECNKKIYSYHPYYKPVIITNIIDDIGKYRGRLRHDLDYIILRDISSNHMKCVKYRSLYITNDVLYYIRKELYSQ